MIRGKMLFMSLAGSTFLGIVLALIQLWTQAFDPLLFSKLLITVVITGALSSFLIALDYDYPASKGKTMLLSVGALACIGALLGLAQLWTEFMAWATFGKLIVSILLVGVLIGLILAMIDDFTRNKRLRKENYID